MLLASAGLVGGMAVYAYHTGRMTPIILALLVVLRLGWDRDAWRRALPGVMAAVLVGLLVLVPLLSFVANNWQGYNRRIDTVSLFNMQDVERRAPLLMVLNNSVPHLLMWHVRGDPNGRHHAPGAPLLDPVAGGLFAVGLGLAAARRNSTAAALLGWLVIGILPGVLSVDAPHAMRSLAAIDPACALAGMALIRLGELWRSPRWVQVAMPGMLGVSLLFNTWLYFSDMPQQPRVFRSFDLAASAAGRIARASATSDDSDLRSVRVFLTREMLGRSDVVRLFTSGMIPAYYDGRRFSEPPGAQALVLLGLDATDEARMAVLELLGPDARELDPPRDPAGIPLLLAFGVGEHAERLVHSAWPP
ncbi:MAG TPA: hypothetical protein PKC19_15320 [Roseiflexaceae bacterium]|nr:hypothetical protein [Roseiflexaceae bacterium]